MNTLLKTQTILLQYILKLKTVIHNHFEEQMSSEFQKLINKYD